MTRRCALIVLGSFLSLVDGTAWAASGNNTTALFVTGPGVAGGGGDPVGSDTPEVPDLFLGTYSMKIPIQLPPTRGAAAPDLALAYRSRNGDGPFGMGWGIELGSIERSTRPLDYAADDYVLHVGGSAIELVRSGSSYRARFESEFREITRVVASDGRTAWVVTDRVGTVFRYGTTPASRQDNPANANQIFAWQLDGVVDRNGNGYTVSYFKDAGAIYPDTLTWPGCIVRLSRLARDDAENSHRLDFPVRTGYVVKTIEIRAQGTLARAYRLTYTPNATFKTVLSRVEQFGKDASIDPTGNVTGSPLPPTTFSWPTASAQPLQSWPASAPPMPLDHGGARVVDLNGDGLPDILWGLLRPAPDLSAYVSDLRAWLNTPSGWVRNDAYDPPTEFYWTVLYPYAGSWILVGHDRGARLVDLNGDGLPDLIQGLTYYQGSPPHGGIHQAWINNGGNCSTPGCAWTPAPEFAPPVDASGTLVDLAGANLDLLSGDAGGWDSGVRFVDVDDDGRPDLIRGWHDGTVSHHEAWLNTITGWVWAPIHAPPVDFAAYDGYSRYAYSRGVQVLANLSGDGAPFILQGAWDNGQSIRNAWRNSGSGWVPAPEYVPPADFVGRDAGAPSGWDAGVRLGDLNGDGRVDLIQGWYNFGTSTRLAWLNTGKGWTPSSLAPPPGIHFTGRDSSSVHGWDAGTRLVDLNGDGRQDLIQGWSAWGTVYRRAWISTSALGWVESPSYAPPIVFTTTDSNNKNGKSNGLVAADFDGDGRADLVQNYFDTSSGATAAGAWVSFFGSPSPPLDLVAGVDNGIGGTKSLTFYPSTQYHNTLLPFPLWNLTSIVVNDGNGVGTGITVSYGGGFYYPGNSHTSEFRGFSSVTVSQAVPNSGDVEHRYSFFQGAPLGTSADSPYVPVAYLKGKLRQKQRAWNRGFFTNTDIEQTTYQYWPATGPSYFAPLRSTDTASCIAVLFGSLVCGSTAHSDFVDWAADGSEISPYDAFGNVLRENQYGDLADSDDDRTIIRTYSVDSPTHIVSLPTSETIFAGAGRNTPIVPVSAGLPANLLTNQLSRKEFFYDGIVNALDCSSTGATRSPTRGNLSKTVSWLNGDVNPEEWRGYDGYGNLTCVSDPDRRLTTYGYDSSATFRTLVRNAMQHTTRTEYYGVDGIPADKGLYGQPKRVVDPNLAERSFEYDSFGRKTVEAQPPVPSPLAGPPFPGFTTTTNYYLGAVGTSRIESTTSDGAWSASFLDGLGRTYLRKKKGSSTGRVFATRTQFDSMGMTFRTSLPYEDIVGATPRWTTYGYDGFGRITMTIKPDGTTTMTCYDNLERGTVTVDANRHRRRSVGDVRGNIVVAQEYLGTYASCTTEVGSPYTSTRYKYDAMNRLHLVTDVRGTVYQTDYDTLGRTISRSDPDLGNWTYHYSAAGDLLSQMDGTGNLVTLVPDELHRVALRSYPDGTSVAYGYDDATVPYSKGRLTSMTYRSVATAQGYDAVGRPWRNAVRIDGQWYTMFKEYDVAGRTAAETYPDGFVATYAYDPDGYLWKVAGAVGNNPPTTYGTLTAYNALAQPGRLLQGNNVATQYSYYDTTNNRLSNAATAVVGGPALLNLSFSYDAVRNVTRVDDGLQPTLSQAFTYDELDRMVGESSSYRAGGGLTFTYGNPIRPHVLTSSSDGKVYQHDAGGNMRADGTRAMTYDYENRLECVAATQADCAASSATATFFTYDGNGRRVKKQGVSGTTIYVGRLYECTGNVCTRHVFAGDKRIASARSDGTVLYYHPDHLGSTRVATNQTGAMVQAIAYRPFGASAGFSGVKYRFTSQELDFETGLYYQGARYYSPSLARFISADPSAPPHGVPQALNRYTYARNNPLRYEDPSGYSPQEASPAVQATMWDANPYLMAVIIASNNYSPAQFEQDLRSGALNNLKYGSGNTLRGLAGEAMFLREQVRYGMLFDSIPTVAAVPSPKFIPAAIGPGFANMLPDVLAVGTAGRLDGVVISRFGTIGSVVLGPPGRQYYSASEIKAGYTFEPGNLVDNGYLQTVANRAMLKAFPPTSATGVGVWVLDRDVWDRTRESTKARLFDLMPEGTYIFPMYGLAAGAESDAAEFSRKVAKENGILFPAVPAATEMSDEDWGP